MPKKQKAYDNPPEWIEQLEADKGTAKDGCLDFYWKWEYENTPWSSNLTILKVYPSKTTLFIKPAYKDYGFPEIRTANGDIVVFSKGIGIEKEPSKELERQLNEIVDNIKGEAYGNVREAIVKNSDKLRHTIAVRQLKKGRLVNNMGKIEFSRRIYTKPIFDNSGESFEITRAANFGYRKEGKLVTTKGISQLDYFKEVGTLNTIAKASKELLGIFDFAADLISVAMDEKPEFITTGYAPLDFLVAMVSPSITEPIKEIWDNVVYDLAEKAKDKGIAGINDFLETNGGQEQRYNFDITRINQETLNKLLKGEFDTLGELRDDLQKLRTTMNEYEYRTQLIYTLFHYKKNPDDDDDDAILIDTIFINQ